MPQQTKYKEEIIKELQDIQEKDMPKLLENNSLFKNRYKKRGKKAKVKKRREPLWDLKKIAVETGIKDLAEHHDHYLYGISKG